MTAALSGKFQGGKLSIHKLLTVSYGLGAAGTTMTSVAVTLHLAQQSFGISAVTVVLVLNAVAGIVIAPVLAPLFDRYALRYLLLVGLISDACVLGIMAATPQPMLLVLGSFLSACAAGVIVPAIFQLASSTSTSAEARVFANLDTARMVGAMVGPLLSGVILEAVSFRAVLVCEILAILFMLLVVFCSAEAKNNPGEQEQQEQASYLARIRQAPALLFRNVQARAALQSLWGAIIFTAMYNTAIVFYAVDVLGVSGIGYAVLLQAFIAGRLLGTRLAARVDKRALAVLILSGVGMGCCFLFVGLFHLLWLALGMLLLAGLCNALQVGALRILVMFAVPEHIRPKAMSTMSSVNTSAMLIGYVVSAPLLGAIGASPTLIVAGVGTAAVTVVSYVSVCVQQKIPLSLVRERDETKI